MKFILEINLSSAGINCKEELTDIIVQLADDIDNGGRCKLHSLEGKVYDQDDDPIGHYSVKGEARTPRATTAPKAAPRKRAKRAAKAPHPGAPPSKRGRGRPRKESPALVENEMGAG